MMSNSKKDIAIADLRTFLEEAYPIGKVTAIESITCDEEELLRSAGSLPEAHQLRTDELRSSFRVSTEGEEYFLKRVSAWVADDQLERIEHFLKWTVARKLDLCPALIQTRSGESHIRMGDQRYQLCKFIEQEKRHIWMRSCLTDTDCALAGALLARMHLASVEYLGENPDKKDAFSISWDYQTSCENLFQRIKGEKAASYPALVSVAKNEDYLKSRFLRAIHVMSTQGKCVVPLLVHGDFHPGNVLFFKDETGSRSVRLVDFDYLRKENPLHDLGYALIMFARSRSLKKSKRSKGTTNHQLDWQLVRAFARGYIRSLHKDPAETDEFKIRKAEVMAACLNAHWVLQYMTFSCFLTMDWAVEKLISGPGLFSDVYADVIETMERLVCFEVGEEVFSVWAETLTE